MRDPRDAQISIAAMEAGKHVDCEKPLTRYLDGPSRFMRPSSRTGKVFQVGSQGWLGGRVAEVRGDGQGGQDRHAGLGARGSIAATASVASGIT